MAAVKYLTPINLNKNELQNARVQNLATPPASPVTGQLYYDTDDNILYFYNGSSWVSTSGQTLSPGSSTATTSFNLAKSDGSASTYARSDHTHGTPAHDATAHSAISLSALAVPTGDVSFGNYKITDVADPTSGANAANKSYVDSIAAGLTDFKQSVRVATTASITTLGTPTIDGVVVAVGDRVLVKNQSTPSSNGIYVAAAGAWLRATDADGTGEISVGTLVYVESGTANGGQQWICSATGDTPWVSGTSSSTWVVYSSMIANEAGAGLTSSNGALNVGAGTGITVNADDVAVNTTWFETQVESVLQGDVGTDSGLVWYNGKLVVDVGAGLDLDNNTVQIDPATVPRKMFANTGPAADGTSWAINHGANNRDVIVQVYDATTYAEVVCDIVRTSTTVVTLNFSSTVTANSLRAVVLG